MKTKKESAIELYQNRQHVLSCPLCHHSMSVQNQTIVCDNMHSYDISRKGTINLSFTNNDQFYDRSFFISRQKMIKEGIFDSVISTITSHITTLFKTSVTLLDVGTGEGSLLQTISQHINGRIFGIDLSKDAIALATNLSTEISWIVADITNLPFKDHQFDCILDVFSPANYNEFIRVLKKEGVLIKVVPLATHFKELRQEQVTDKDESKNIANIEQVLKQHFDIVSKERVVDEVEISPHQKVDIMIMSPVSKNKSSLSTDFESITIDVFVYVCKKKSLF